MKHISVMLNESLDLLNINPEGVYIDATLGAGGHSLEICKRLTTGKLICFDKDADAIVRGTQRLEAYQDKVTLVHSSYTDLRQTLNQMGIDEVDGVLFDLGVSSPQFDDAARGFSYRFDSKLDMRMDQSQALSAYVIVNEYEEDELVRIFKDNAEERYAKRIASEIIKARPVETTFDLVDIIKKSYPSKELKKGHPAKKVFQALRIEVNDEFGEAKDAINQAIHSIKPKGRVVVITFHSLEDRMVKNIFNTYGKPPKVNPRIPVIVEDSVNYQLIKKGIKPSIEELEENNRAHSAILRCIERMK